MTTDQPEQKPATQQLSLAKVQTPDGERLMLQVAMFLDADQAQALAGQLGQQAAGMSRTGLVTAGGLAGALAQDR